MQKITSHIGNPSKFSKASKLALQLIEAGSVKPGTIGHFFAILEAAMSSPGACNEHSVRADYQALFNAAQGVTEAQAHHQARVCWARAFPPCFFCGKMLQPYAFPYL